jgi:cytochrome c556
MAAQMNKRLIALLGLSAGLLVSATASAWYGGWYRPYGSGAMVYERQTIMRKHGYAMDDLSRMFDGRRAFDRDEAVRLAKALEEGFSGKLVANTAPGTLVAGSRTAPWTWNHFQTFQGYNEAAKQSAARLAEALARSGTTEDTAEQAVWVPAGRPPHGPLAAGRDGHIPLRAVREYQRLQATCYSCHVQFRGRRW